MSKRETGLFKRSGSEIFEYDFRVSGHRFHGSTGCTSRRDAEAFVRSKKAEARAGLADKHKTVITFGVACAKWWEERGRFCTRPTVVEDMLAKLQEWIGLRTKLADIDDAMVARIVAKRRAEGVTSATVNRSFTEPLRRIILRARDKWKYEVADIDWPDHLLQEPKERIREMTVDEEAAIWKHLKPDYVPLLTFAKLTGVRRAGCLGLKWSAVNFGTRKIHIIGKGGEDYTIPLTPTLRELLWPLQASKREFVFCYRRERNSATTRRGEWTPISEDRLQAEMDRVRKLAGIKNSREDTRHGLRLHDLRHTAGSRITRATRNVKVAKELLGHRDIQSTMRYVHVLDDEVADGIEAVAKTSEKSSETTKRKTRKTKA